MGTSPQHVVLIDPQGTIPGLNTGYAYLAAALRQAGHTVLVIDFNNCARDEDVRLQEVRRADIIGVGFKSFTIEEGVRLAALARQLNPTARLICGGPHITIDGNAFMKEHTLFDAAVVGDGENAICEIAEGREFANIAGLIVRKDAQLLHTPQRSSLKELDSLPFPDFTCFDSLSKYKMPFPFGAYPLVTSRGCPCNCIYCSVPVISGRRWRYRSPENMLKELQEMQKTYACSEFCIYDDNFTVNIERAKKFCRLLISDGSRLRWSCPNGIKAQGTDDELASLMKSAGVTAVNFGIESAIPEVFQTIGKGGTLQDIKDAILRFRAVGIRVGGFFLTGLPGMTAATERQNIDLARKMGLDFTVWSFLVPYPGTELFRRVHEDREYKLLRRWQQGAHIGEGISAVFETNSYPAAERVRMYKAANILTRNYAGLVSQRDSTFKKVRILLFAILRHDPWHAISHVSTLVQRLLARSSQP